MLYVAEWPRKQVSLSDFSQVSFAPYCTLDAAIVINNRKKILQSRFKKMLQGAKWMLKNLHSKCLFWKWVSKDRFPVLPDLLKNNEWFFINHLNFCYLIIIIIFCDYTFLRVSAFTEKKKKQTLFPSPEKKKKYQMKKRP